MKKSFILALLSMISFAQAQTTVDTIQSDITYNENRSIVNIEDTIRGILFVNITTLSGNYTTRIIKN